MKKIMQRMYQRISIPMILLTILIFNSTLLEVNNARASEGQTFQVPVQMMRADDPSSLSMGNQGLVSTATVYEDEGGAHIYLQLLGIDLQGMSGHLTHFYHYENGTLYDSGVTETIEDYGLDGELDTFISGVVLDRSTLRENTIRIRVRVDAMDSIMGGEGLGEQDAILSLDYSNAPALLVKEEKTSSEQEEERKEEPTEEKKEETSSNKEEVKKEAKKEVEEAKAEVKEATIQLKKVADYFRKLSLEKGTYLIDLSGKYLNPLTGETEDGGKNASVGEGMVDGVIAPLDEAYISDGEERLHKALLEKDEQGYFATIRLYQMNFIQKDKEKGPFFYVLQENGEFQKVEAVITGQGGKPSNQYIDFKIPVPTPTFLAKVDMFVGPMNRNVTYFVESDLRNLEEGRGEFNVSQESKVEKKPWVIYLGGAIAVMAVLSGVVLIVKKKMNVEKG